MSTYRERLLVASSINSPARTSISGHHKGDTDDEDERVDDDDGVDDVDEAEQRRTDAVSGAPSSRPSSSAGGRMPELSPKRRRYQCCGLSKGVLLTHPQYVASVLLLTAVVLAAVLSVVFLAIVPAIIASTVSAASVSIGAVRITAPDSGARTLHLTTSLSITRAGAFSAQLHSMSVSISRRLPDGSYSASMGSVTAPAIALSGDTTATIDGELQVGDAAAFDGFVRALLNEREVTWHLSASASITPSLGGVALPTYSSIAFEKDVSVAGCGGLNVSWVDTFSLQSSNATAVNLDLHLTILNPSSFTIAPLGTLHFLVMYQGQYIGDVYAADAELVAGNSSLHLRGSLARTNGSAELALIQLFLTGQPVAVEAAAAADASSVALFNEGMQGLRLTTVVPGNTLDLVRALSFQSMQLTPSATGLSARVDAGVVVSINSPLGSLSPLLLQRMAIDSVLMYESQVVGELVSAAMPVLPVYALPNSTVTDTFSTNITGELRLTGDGHVYAAFVAALVPATALTLTVSGTTNISAQYVLGQLSVSALPITAQSKLAGLQSLAPVVERALNITGALSCAAPPCGLSVSMLASLYNPAPVAVTLQRSALLLSYRGERMGRMMADVLDIRPGENLLSLTGELWPSSDPATSSAFIDDFIHARPVTVQLAGDASQEVNGSATALTTAALRLNATVSGQDCAASVIRSIALTNVSIDFRNDSVFVSATARAAFALPDNLAMPGLSIASTGLSATIWINASTSMGAMSLPGLPVSFEHHLSPPDYLNLSLVQAELVVADHETAAFTAFADALLLSHSASFTMYASASPVVDSPLGPLTLAAVPANASVTFTGLNRFLSPSGVPLIRILSYDIVDATASSLLVSTSVSVENPSNASLHSLGTLRLDLVFDGAHLGQVTLPSFSLPLGTAYHTALANISRPTTNATAAALDAFVSAMINQTASAVTLEGGLVQEDGTIVPGTSIPLLQPTIRSFISPSTFPGLSSPFIERFDATLSLALLRTHSMPTSLQVMNPFSAKVMLLSVNISVYATEVPGLRIGYWVEDLRALGREIVFAPHTSQSSGVVNITVALGDTFEEQWRLLKELLGDRLILPVNSVGWVLQRISSSSDGDGEGFEQLVHIDARAVDCRMHLPLP